LNQLLEAFEKGKPPWKLLFEKLGAYFDKRFGPEWKAKEKEFWSEFSRTYQIGKGIQERLRHDPRFWKKGFDPTLQARQQTNISTGTLLIKRPPVSVTRKTLSTPAANSFSKTSLGSRANTIPASSGVSRPRARPAVDIRDPPRNVFHGGDVDDAVKGGFLAGAGDGLLDEQQRRAFGRQVEKSVLGRTAEIKEVHPLQDE